MSPAEAATVLRRLITLARASLEESGAVSPLLWEQIDKASTDLSNTYPATWPR